MGDTSFENNSRRKHELIMRPAIDAIYTLVWPGCVIKRFERTEESILDIRFAIDVQVTLPNGMIMTGQEKALTYQYRTQRTVTVEFWNDPITKEKPGDWFHLASQFYFCGYSTQDRGGFDPWLSWIGIRLLNLPVEDALTGKLTGITKRQQEQTLSLFRWKTYRADLSCLVTGLCSRQAMRLRTGGHRVKCH